ncbi:hypothetical protein CYMTET_6774 [Cymbomonas tetramitiformis]|uniref:DUF7734 domain-containing protein n=1 Tax=Cymbomonas tetramitiformis TaxID=36881 RepID=A0AAE0GWJ4_9CHLO|nr:hypothetical protein CYMTET_6774 [Cymbomonas tetramitiformis]
MSGCSSSEMISSSSHTLLPSATRDTVSQASRTTSFCLHKRAIHLDRTTQLRKARTPQLRANTTCFQYSRYRPHSRSFLPRAYADGDDSAGKSFLERLESYTEIFEKEVLVVRASVEDEEDEILVFRGFSSSLFRPTPEDLSESVLPVGVVVNAIDRMPAPYDPGKECIQEGMSVAEFESFLTEKGM